ncbi:putative oxidoreductase [Colletotrichum siamense]|uniref:Oxidoreductase n=1 Tax=Colletotrichum siamense TaxID=690259 RepID=A0A9P5ECZ2_COLSI|nr:putative oxidoreductase [Colletotrichum siamense]KAF4842493.1 putative oxidoreductase [Colletotrichum siamense]
MPHNNTTWSPEKHIKSLKGKSILITGGSNGLGRQSALDLAKHQPTEIWLAARSASRAEAVIDEIKQLDPSVSVKFLPLDLTSFSSIREAARIFLASATRLDILLLNAGVMNVPVGTVTKEGYEMHFGTNHVGHALLVKLLTPLLRQTALSSEVRVVLVSSVAHRFGPSGGLQFDSFKPKIGNSGLSPNALYGQSKLANLLFAHEMARRCPEWTTVSIHPGTVKTDLQRSESGPFLIKAFQAVVVPLIGVSVEEGAKNQLWAATADGVLNGEYYVPVGVPGKGSALSKDEDLARKLWDWTEAELRGIEP